jgi:hypothetical protein
LGGEGKRLARVTLLTAGLNQKVKPDFSDIRFSTDGVAMLDHSLVHLNHGSTAYFIVDTSQVTNNFYIYFGNPNATSMSGSYDKFKNVNPDQGGIAGGHFFPSPTSQSQKQVPYSGTIPLQLENPIVQESLKTNPTPRIDPTPFSVITPTQTLSPATVQPQPDNMTFLVVIASLTFFIASFSVVVVLKIRRQK